MDRHRFRHPVSAVNFIEFVWKIINSSCLVFRDNRYLKSKPRLFIAIFLTLLLFYQTINDILYTLFYADQGLVTSIMMSCWSIQASFSAFFLIYWQLKGKLHRLLDQIRWAQFKAYDRKTAFILRIFHIGFFSCICYAFSISLMTIHSYYLGNLSIIDLKASYFENYGGPKFAFITSIVKFHGMHIWFIVITIYCTISWIIYKEIEVLNSYVKRIGEINIDDKSEIADRLLKLYDHQIMLSLIIEEINSIFEVYSFLMLGSSVPIMIFSLVTVIQRLKSSAYSSVVMMSGVCFCMFEIVVLTHMPSKIHASIRSIEKSIFISRVFWFPYNQKLYQISQMFVSHVSQSSLGISLWGFTLINKSLILSTSSLIVTYLVLLIEMDGDQSGVDGSSICNCMNNSLII